MDSMADTSCAGKNWKLIELTGMTCNVYPFKDGYEPTRGVPVATCATLVQGEGGSDFILVGHEMLYFGPEMDRTLLNQNQIRNYIRHEQGRLQDDYTREDEPFGITTTDAFIPFHLEGASVTFESRVPSMEEWEELPHVVITDKAPWDPKQPLRTISHTNTSGRYNPPIEYETDTVLRAISPVYIEQELRNCIIGSVMIQGNAQRNTEHGIRNTEALGLGAHAGTQDTPECPWSWGACTNTERITEALGLGAACTDTEHTLGLGVACTDTERDMEHTLGLGVAYTDTDTEYGSALGFEAIKTSLIGAAYSATRHSIVTPELLSRQWSIGLDTARQTLRATTQNGIRTAIHPITRRYRVDHLHLHRRRLNRTFFTDTLFSRVTSLRGHKCAQVFTDGAFTAVYPMHSKKEAGDALRMFIQDVGIPDTLMADLAGEQTGDHTEFVKQAKRNDISLHWAEKGRKNQNHRAEREIGILKARWKARMSSTSAPSRLWCYGLVYEAEIMSRYLRTGQDRTGLEQLTGQTPDISEWLDFTFYDLVWCHTSGNEVGTPQRVLGRWIGVSHRIGSDLCYWILIQSGKVLASTTVQHVTTDDAATPAVALQITHFTESLRTRLADDNFTLPAPPGTSPYIQDWYPPPDDTPRRGQVPSAREYGDMLYEEAPDDDVHENLDNYIHAELVLEVGGEPLYGRVIKRAINQDGTKKGQAHRNPMFDTRAYLVEMADGSVNEYTANIIAENIYSQIDAEGRSYSLLKEISGYRKNPSVALTRANGYTISANGNRAPKKTTKGWEMQVEWKDGTTEWVSLKRMKDYNPVETAEYAVANQIDNEPAFQWWVKDVLRHRNRIVGKVKSKYWKTTHKFGVRLPKTAKEALQIDKETGTDFWQKAIEKELRKVKVAWEARDDLTIGDVRSGKALKGYTEINCHMIFDVKMDFTRKARFVAGGHMTEAPSSITYSSVVSRDSVRLAFLVAELNGLDIMACDIGNAYLNAPCREKVWFVGGIDTGADHGKVLVICRALYGLKSSGASWRATLAQTLRDLGFEETLADPDVWRRTASHPDGRKYYELLLVYVDDILLVSTDPKVTLLEIGKSYEIKEGSLSHPDTYLGAQIHQQYLQDGRKAWAMSSYKYVKNAVATIEALIQEDGDGFHLRTTAKVPMPQSYRPELDTSKELDQAMLSRYRQLIGILRWAVELGRVDIYYEVAVLSQYLASPREGHLEALYQIFAYLKKHPKTSIVFDPINVTLDASAFAPFDVNAWREFYGDVVEELPTKMPEPLGNAVDITCFVDSDHAGNVVTRRSHTGILIFVQNAPILWYSKKQNTIESSSFGSEFVALRIAKEMIVALRYKLRMFGIPLRGPASVLCDNQGVVKNTSLPESTLSKRHNAINYHAVREAAAAGILRVGKEDGHTNLADAFTKTLNASRRYDLFSRMTYSSMFASGDKRVPDINDSDDDPKKRTKFV